MSMDRIDFEWDRVGATPPDELVPARNALHNAAQVVAAAGQALLPARADDSHTTMEWNDGTQALVGERLNSEKGSNEFQIGLRLRDATLLVVEATDVTEELSLEGRTVADGLAWLRDPLDRRGGTNKEVSLPSHYEILSPMGKDETFAIGSREASAELARYFAGADHVFRALPNVLPEASSIRCWPHHFDIGGLLVLEPSKSAEEAKTVGFGLSPGDDNYSEPYFYINPYPSSDITKDPLPSLEGSGFWHTEGWIGAVLPASRFSTIASREKQKDVVKTHILSGFAASFEVLRTNQLT